MFLSKDFGHSRDRLGVLKHAGFYWRFRSVERECGATQAGRYDPCYFCQILGNGRDSVNVVHQVVAEI